MRSLILGALIILLSANPATTAELAIKQVNGIQFHAPMLEKAVVPQPYLNISFGKGPAEVGGSLQDGNYATEGVPVAFLPQKDGSIWVLDAVLRRLQCFGPTGKHLKTISLETVAAASPPVRDFAPGPEFGFYLLDPAENMIKRLDKDGKLLASIEGLGDVRTIAADATGHVFAADSFSDGILCFNPAGELVWQISGMDGLSPYTDGRGHPYGLKGEEANAVLFRVDDPTAKTIVELGKFPLEFPPDQNVTYAQHRILGIDDNGNVYFELLATNPDGVVFLHRFYRVSPDGKKILHREVQIQPFFAPDITRDFVVLPEGRILGFTADETTYRLLSYDLN
jgi:hypothetical protein